MRKEGIILRPAVALRNHGHGSNAGRCAGVTLVELMAALAVLAIVSTLAVPGLAHLYRSASRVAAVNDFMHSVFLARSRAIMTGGVVSICRSVDGKLCANQRSQWEDGWIVFQNLDHDLPVTRDPGEPVIERHGPWNGGRITTNRVAYSFRPMAQGDVNGTLVFCDPRESDDEARAIIISHTGRPRVSKRDASRRVLHCL